MPLRELIKSRLDLANIEYEEVSGSEWIKVKCLSPDHNDSKPSAGINTTSGIHNCFSCGHRFMFIKQDDNQDDADVIWKARYANLKRTIQSEYPDFDSIHETILARNKELFEPPIDFMLTEEWRGLSPELLSDCEAYYCSRGKLQGRYVFPAKEDGVFKGCDARIVDASAQMLGAKWYRLPGMQAKDVIYPKDVLTKRFTDLSHIVIVEGVADALSYIQMGVPAIASFGLTPPSNIKIENLIRMGVTKVTIAFDNDEAGLAGTLKVLPIYAEWFDIVPHQLVTMVRNSGYKDANLFLTETKQNGLKTQTYEDNDDEY